MLRAGGRRASFPPRLSCYHVRRHRQAPGALQSPGFAGGGPFPLGRPQQGRVSTQMLRDHAVPWAVSGWSQAAPSAAAPPVRASPPQAWQGCPPQLTSRTGHCARVSFTPQCDLEASRHSGTGHSGPALAGRSWGSSFGPGCVVSRLAVGRREPGCLSPRGPVALPWAWHWVEAEWPGPCAGKRDQSGASRGPRMQRKRQWVQERPGRGSQAPGVTGRKTAV